MQTRKWNDVCCDRLVLEWMASRVNAMNDWMNEWSVMGNVKCLNDIHNDRMIWQRAVPWTDTDHNMTKLIDHRVLNVSTFTQRGTYYYIGSNRNVTYDRVIQVHNRRRWVHTNNARDRVAQILDTCQKSILSPLDGIMIYFAVRFHLKGQWNCSNAITICIAHIVEYSHMRAQCPRHDLRCKNSKFHTHVCQPVTALLWASADSR